MRHLIAAAALTVSGLAHADIIYSDGTFSNANWGFEFVTQGAGGAASAFQMPVGGNPEFCRRVELSLEPGGGAQIAALSRFGTTMATRYDPATQGAIETVSFRIDYRNIVARGTAGQFVQVGVKQGTALFAAAGAFTGDAAEWTSYSVSGLTASTFLPVFGGPQRPDFSEAGQPLRFGFLTRHTGSGETSFSTVDYDNFLVRIVRVPAPGAAASLLAAALVLPRRRRRESPASVFIGPARTPGQSGGACGVNR